MYLHYRRFVTITRRTVLTAISVAAAAQAQRQRTPSWKPRLGVLGQYSEANLEFIKADGFTSWQVQLNPDRLDDAAIAAIKDKIQASGIYASSVGCDGNHIDPDPAARARQIQKTIKTLELCGKLGIPNIGGQSGTIKGQPLQAQVDEIVKVYTEKYFPAVREEQGSHLVGTLRRRTQHRHRPGRLGSAFQGLQQQPVGGLATGPVAPGVADDGPGAGRARLRR